MEAITAISPVPIRFDEIEGSAKGYYDNANKEIVIQMGMSDSQIIKTAIHECGHAKLHDRDLMKSAGVQKDRETKKVEAESVAYSVCSAFQIETSDYSFPYIAGWSTGRDMKELRTSMDTIRQTAGEMVDELTEKLQQLIEFMLCPFIWMPIAFIMPKSRVWGNEIHIKITTCKEYESHEMANAYYTSGSCS